MDKIFKPYIKFSNIIFENNIASIIKNSDFNDNNNIINNSYYSLCPSNTQTYINDGTLQSEYLKFKNNKIITTIDYIKKKKSLCIHTNHNNKIFLCVENKKCDNLYFIK